MTTTTHARARELLPVGTRIRFTKTIIEPADDDHPAFHLASKGDEGTIVGHHSTDLTFPYSVTWEEWPAPFSAAAEDFELVAK